MHEVIVQPDFQTSDLQSFQDFGANQVYLQYDDDTPRAYFDEVKNTSTFNPLSFTFGNLNINVKGGFSNVSSLGSVKIGSVSNGWFSGEFADTVWTEFDTSTIWQEVD
jgi:hypothetical protein